MNLREAVRRSSKVRALLAHFSARPGVWVRVEDLARVGGFCAWRTRLSEARRQIVAAVGVLEWNGQVRRSAYRFLPHMPLGRDAATSAPQKRLF